MTSYLAALEVRTRERVPLDWARTQYNLATALFVLGEREEGTARLEEAMKSFWAVLEVFEVAGVNYYLEATQRNLTRVEEMLTQRRSQDD